jgi:hypothetical protein
MPRGPSPKIAVTRDLTAGRLPGIRPPLKAEGEGLPALALPVALQCTLIFFEVVDAFPAVSRTVTVTVKSPFVV